MFELISFYTRRIFFSFFFCSPWFLFLFIKEKKKSPRQAKWTCEAKNFSNKNIHFLIHLSLRKEVTAVLLSTNGYGWMNEIDFTIKAFCFATSAAPARTFHLDITKCFSLMINWKESCTFFLDVGGASDEVKEIGAFKNFNHSDADFLPCLV